jgi:hypothetical protein
MKRNRSLTMCICLLLFVFSKLYAQDSTTICKVELKSLTGTYSGECKNGLAHGKGEAKGLHRYVGIFRNGLPNGKGIYYYNDNEYYAGNFQDGVKEGKGEAHYLRNGMPDSVVSGYWSANEFRGKSYKTYNVSETGFFDRVSISPSAETGNTMVIEISTTSGSPNGAGSAVGASGYVLTINDVIATDGGFVRKLNTFSSSNKFSATYEIGEYPVRLQVIVSNGQIVNLELYKAAKWTVRFFVNK